MEANVAYYCLHELHWLPSAYAALSFEERAFVTAAIEVKVEAERKREKDAVRRGGRRR